jgi:tetratricopeptide (TPR) repeat protein
MLKYLPAFDEGTRYMRKAFILSLFLVPTLLQAATWESELKEAVRLQRQGKLKAAEQMLLKAQLEAASFGANDPREAYTLDYLGTLYMQEGAKEDALAVFAKALRGFDTSLGPDSAEAQESAKRLAEAYEADQQWEKAEPLYRRLAETARKDTKTEPLALAERISDLAFSLDAQKKWDEAMPLYDEALKLRQKALGDDAAEVAETLNNQARIWLLKGDAPKAIGLFRRALAIDEKALGKDHPSVADDLHRLAAALTKAGKAGEAGPLDARAERIMEKAAENAAKKKGPKPHARPLPKPE